MSKHTINTTLSLSLVFLLAIIFRNNAGEFPEILISFSSVVALLMVKKK